MPAWTNITNALVAVGAKPFATTIQALRDNPIAIAEGAPGAPRLFLPAFERLVAGDSVRLTVANGNTAETSFVDVRSFGVSGLQAGTVRVKFSHRRSSVGSNGEIQVARRRGGVLAVLSPTYSATSTTSTPVSFDAEVQPGDELFLRARTLGSSSNVIAENISLSLDPTAYLWPPGWVGTLSNPTFI